MLIKLMRIKAVYRYQSSHSNGGTEEALVRLKRMRILCASSGRQIVFGDHLRTLGFECRLRHVTGGGTCCRDVTAAGRALRVNYVHAPPLLPTC